ncbi:MAG TPA: GtrA family protein [Egibacteraceae bacterium]|nr:GtrA family protein [Egibacteraceae bacterium]
MTVEPHEEAFTAPPGTAAGEIPIRDKPGVLKAMFRFGAVGGAGTLVNLAVLYLLHGRLGLHPTVSSAIATETAIIGNYIGNELWTFHHRALDLGRLLRFNTISAGALFVTIGVFHFLHHAVGVHYLLSQLAGIVVGAGVNFTLNFGWTWRR